MNFIKTINLKRVLNLYIRVGATTYVGLLAIFYIYDDKKSTHFEKQKYALFAGYNWPFLAYEICSKKDVAPLSSFTPFSS